MINHGTWFGQQLFHVLVGEPVAQVPTNRDCDHIRREAEPRKPRPQCLLDDSDASTEPAGSCFASTQQPPAWYRKFLKPE
jgi:hypothetical protein